MGLFAKEEQHPLPMLPEKRELWKEVETLIYDEMGQGKERILVGDPKVNPFLFAYMKFNSGQSTQARCPSFETLF